LLGDFGVWLSLAAAEAAAPGAQMQQMLMFFVMIGLAFWFIILRPQKKEQQKRQSMLDAVKKGDRVVTVGGVHGKVSEVDKAGKTLSIQVDGKVTLKLNRSAVSTIVTKDDDEG
jgi:preprotein translocase subunit YajC